MQSLLYLSVSNTTFSKEAAEKLANAAHLASLEELHIICYTNGTADILTTSPHIGEVAAFGQARKSQVFWFSFD